MLTKQQRYTAEEWERFKPLFRRFSHRSFEAARLILVEGLSTPEVGKRLGMPRQQAHRAAERVHSKIAEKTGAGRLPLSAWVPETEYTRIAAYLKKHGCLIVGDTNNPDSEVK